MTRRSLFLFAALTIACDAYGQQAILAIRYGGGDLPYDRGRTLGWVSPDGVFEPILTGDILDGLGWDTTRKAILVGGWEDYDGGRGANLLRVSIDGSQVDTLLSGRDHANIPDLPGSTCSLRTIVYDAETDTIIASGTDWCASVTLEMDGDGGGVRMSERYPPSLSFQLDPSTRHLKGAFAVYHRNVDFPTMMGLERGWHFLELDPSGTIVSRESTPTIDGPVVSVAYDHASGHAFWSLLGSDSLFVHAPEGGTQVLLANDPAVWLDRGAKKLYSTTHVYGGGHVWEQNYDGSERRLFLAEQITNLLFLNGISVEIEASTPIDSTTLSPNFPNPFTHDTTVHYKTDVPSAIVVYDVLGRTVQSVPVSGAGTVTISNLPPGLYVYRLNGTTRIMVAL